MSEFCVVAPAVHTVAATATAAAKTQRVVLICVVIDSSTIGYRLSAIGRLRSPAFPLAVRRWRRFRHHALHGLLLEQAHGLLHRALELRIVAGDHVLRPVLDVDVGRDPLVLDGPLAAAIE